MKRIQILLLLMIAFSATVVVSIASAETHGRPSASEEELKLIEKLQPISIRTEPKEISLNGRFDYRQVLVFGTTAKGETLDLTRAVEVTGSDVAGIDSNRLVTAIKDGSGKLVFKYGKLNAEIPVKVENTEADFNASFKLHVQPVLSRLGCNSGTCHGSKDGKNGFKLSLRGYDSVYDYRSLTDDLAARRFNKAAPDQSLFLLKASGAVPHAGGAIVQPGSPHYEILRSWISQGANYDSGETPKVKSLQVVPRNPIIPLPGMQQQVSVLARYSDGKVRDVTREAFVESGNIEVASTADGGKLNLIRRGEAAALVRFEGAYAATTLTVMGDRSGFSWSQPETFNYVDRLVYDKLKRVKVAPGELCSDEEFIRRVYLDLTGLPPSADAIRIFTADPKESRAKRDALVDHLIGSPEFVEHWTNKWADLLQVNRKFLGEQGAAALRNWIKQSVASNQPYNEFARSVITASGSNLETPAASYYKILREPVDLMENTTHLFLAIRFNCNKCHDHPFERWTQDQYYELTAFFAQVGRKPDPTIGNQRIGGSAVSGAKPLAEIIFDKASGEVKHDRTGQLTAPSFPFAHAGMPSDKWNRRQQLAHWLTSEHNPYFARSFVNRLWGYLFGIGIIDPIDDIRAGNPPSNPELLDALEKDFIESGFNIRHMLATICKSRVYQHSIETNAWNEDDEINFSHFIPRRLPAETLYDAIHFALGAPLRIPGAAQGLRAAQLPDAGVKVPFLEDFGKPVRESACECERSNGVVLGPVMKLINGPTIAEALKNPQSEINQLIDREKDNQKVADEIFLRLIGRTPTEQEMNAVVATIQSVGEGHEELAESLNAYELILASKQAAWEKTALRSTSWQPARPTSARSDAKAQFSIENDGTVYVTGPLQKDVYHIVLEPSLKKLTGIRIDALADKRLGMGGPGRAPNGNFVVNLVQVFAVDKTDPSKRVELKLVKATSDFSQAGWPAANSLQKNDGNGWAIHPQPGKNHFIYFEIEGGFEPENQRIEMVIRHQYVDGKHSLGKFKVSLSDSPLPLSPQKLPPAITTVLKVDPTKRTDAQKKTLRDHFFAMDSGYRELQALVKQSEIEKANPRKTGFQDVAWALINNPSFLFNR